MPTDRTSIVSFFLRTFWPFLAFFLLLSIGLNAFFLTVDRFRQAKETPKIVAPTSTTGSVLQELERGPKAFGVVGRGFVTAPQNPPDGVEVPPIFAYEIPPNMMPSLPASYTLYRDQGVDLDTGLLASVFHKLGVPFNVGSLQFFAKSMSFTSSDRTLEISIDVQKRFLTLKKLGSVLPPASATLADDAECIALAKEFVISMDFTYLMSGVPRVVDRPDATGASKTYVVWDSAINGLPLLDISLRPLPKLEVQVGRLSRRAFLVNVNLLEAGLLARSAYPAASTDAITKRFQSGGFLPLAARKKGRPVSVSFTEFTPAYLLYPADQTHPTYVLPVIKGVWSMEPSCSGCVPVKFSTFVPALDPLMFLWKPDTRPLALPLSPPPSATSSSLTSSVSSSKVGTVIVPPPLAPSSPTQATPPVTPPSSAAVPPPLPAVPASSQATSAQ